MKIIDFHTHCFPDTLAPRAIDVLQKAAGGLLPQTDGTLSGLRASMRQNHVDISCVMNIATNPHQMHAVNDFAASCCAPDIVPFGSVHPDAPDVLDELDRIAALGLKGVKFHPDYQGFFVDEERMRPIYRKISQLSLIVLFHAGQDYGFDTPYHCMPQGIVRALKMLDTPVVAAHWGSLGCGEEVLQTLCGLPLWFDVSFGYGAIPRPLAQHLIEKHGANYILFGSDTPWHSPSMEYRLLESLSLSEEEKEKIYYRNAASLLQIPI